MNKKLPEDITRALDLLKFSESSDTHQTKIKFFKEGIDILNECLEKVPQYKQLLKNHKLSYTRSLITNLSNTKPAIIFDDWLEYVFIFCINVKEEIIQILKADPKVRIYFIDFLALWAEKIPSELKESFSEFIEL